MSRNGIVMVVVAALLVFVPEHRTSAEEPKPPEYGQPEIDPECKADDGCVDDGCWIDEDGDCSIPCEGRDEAHWAREWVPSYPFSNKSCRRTTQAPCERTDACAILGFCSPSRDGERCEFDGSACKKTVGCEWRGECSPSVYGCVPRNDDDCASSQNCRREGLCVKADATIDSPCTSRGDVEPCTPPKLRIDGKCRYPRGYDCASECREDQRCEPLVADLTDYGAAASEEFVACVESDAYCRSQPECWGRGICHALGERVVSFNKCNGFQYEVCDRVSFGGCTSGEEACASSLACKIHGECGTIYKNYGGDQCYPTKEEHCQQSRDCKRYGACGLHPISSYNVCGPTKTEHCEDSQECKTEGRCNFVGDSCVK